VGFIDTLFPLRKGGTMITSAEEWEASKAFNDLATELRDKDHIKAEDVNESPRSASNC
jgi:hypothetical protein